MARTLLFALMLFTAGCAKKPAERLEGRWAVDLEALEQMPEMQRLPEAHRKMQLDMLRAEQAGTRFELSAGELRATVAGKTEQVAYTVKSAEGDRVLLATTDSTGRTEDLRVDLRGDRMVMTMTVGDHEETFPLVRAP